MAHTVLRELYPSMPIWAHEGAAVRVEPFGARGRYRLVYRGNKAEGKLAPLLTFLGDVVPRGETQLEVLAFYAYASVVFEALCRLRGGPRKALQLCEKIGKIGPIAALRKARLTLAKVEATADELAKDTTRDR